MLTWEYLTVPLNPQTLEHVPNPQAPPGAPEAERWLPLDALGAEGWEMITVITAQAQRGHPLSLQGAQTQMVPVAIFKRPLSPARPQRVPTPPARAPLVRPTGRPPRR